MRARTKYSTIEIPPYIADLIKMNKCTIQATLFFGQAKLYVGNRDTWTLAISVLARSNMAQSKIWISGKLFY